MSNPRRQTGSVRQAPNWAGPALLLGVLVLCLGFFAQHQNTLFYQKFAPFFDSAAYTNGLAQTVSEVNTQGALPTLRQSLNSTGPLPLFETILFAKLGIVKFPMTRALGVWLQMIWLTVLAFAVFAYLHFCRRMNRGIAVIYTVPFIAFEGIFFFNGGLADFRLDLSLYLLSSITITFYLFTYWRESYVWWLLAGIFAGLTCLTRATAAVYLPLMLGPIIIVRLFRSPRRWRIVAGIGITLTPAALISLAYLFYAYDYLHYYYVVWNADANAKLPLRQSIVHLYLAFRHVGFYPSIVLILAFSVAILECGIRKSMRHLDWKLLYLGFAPLLFLVFRGAGANPFVSMPAVFGFTLSALVPVNIEGPKTWSRLRVIACLAILSTCVSSAVRIPSKETANLPPIAGMRKTIDSLRSHARGKEIRFMTTHIWNLQATLMRNVLVYEYGAIPEGGGLRDRNGTLWKTPMENQFSPAVPVVWEQGVNGADDSAKIEYLLTESRKELDYLTFPEDESIAWMEVKHRHNFANLKVRQIKKRFLQSGEWTPVSDVIENVPNERFRIYAKVSLSGSR